MAEQNKQEEILAHATEIVSAYVSNNTVASENISSVIRDVYATLCAVVEDGGEGGVKPNPAVPVEESVQPDYLVCLEDGKQLKMLKRYLKTSYDMSPDEYRERWGLPEDYPMVAPNYAEHRSRLAKDIGLGKR